MIAQSQISKLSNRLLKELGGRRIPEAVLERDYCIAWFLVGLSKVPLRELLAFKGGTALKRVHFGDYRFSEDLDFTLLKEVSSLEELKKELEPLYEFVKKLSNITFRFSREDSNSHQNSHTFYLAYEGLLPTTSQAKEIKVDVTIRELMVDKPQELVVLASYSEYTDLPSDASILGYSLSEIATEKTVALMDRARTEPRDLYDLWFLTHQTKRVNLAECLHGIELKLKHRGKTLDDVRGEFDKKEARLERTWESRLSAQMNSLPEFEGVYRAVKRNLRQAGITESA
jgi:predicted nucleotidyltransferase component of viral defense system